MVMGCPSLNWLARIAHRSLEIQAGAAAEELSFLDAGLVQKGLGLSQVA